MSELKPCPFCGSENIAVGSDKGTVYRRNTAFGDLTRSVPTVRWAYCVDCGCVAPAEKVNNFDGFYKPDEQEDALNRAISAWNRRAQPANEPLTLDELRKVKWYEPVYVKFKHAIPDKAGSNLYDCLCYIGASASNYGKTWIAYRCPPEMFIGVDLASGHDFTTYRRPPERSGNE